MENVHSGAAEGRRKCSGYGERHVSLYIYVILYTSKSRPVLAGVAYGAEPPVAYLCIVVCVVGLIALHTRLKAACVARKRSLKSY